MKKIFVVVSLVLAFGLAGPKIIGNSMNQNISDFIANLNEMPGYQLKIKSLETGWFSTTAEVNVGLILRY